MARLRQEIGISTALEIVDRFACRAVNAERSVEHESCSVLEGRWDCEIHPDPREVSEYAWVTLDELRAKCDVWGLVAPWLERWVTLLGPAETAHLRRRDVNR